MSRKGDQRCLIAGLVRSLKHEGNELRQVRFPVPVHQMEIGKIVLYRIPHTEQP